MVVLMVILGLWVQPSWASVLSLSKIAGTYEVTSEVAPIINVIEISASGEVKLIERSPYGMLNCKGKATLKKGVLESLVTCDNGQKFTQRVNLNGVEHFDRFTANVFSSLYEAEVPMKFVRL